MSKNLVIVESPNKVKKIQSYLGADYIVKASVGHIRNLPTKELGINENTHKPRYCVAQGKSRVVSGLKALANNASTIYLATDPDREGEAIAWHLKEVLGANKNYKRVTYTEITKSALTAAFNNPTDIDYDMVQGQEARRVLDRYYGYKVSPVLTEIEGQKFTAGRVQSPAVALVVMRKLERDSFEAEEYLSVSLMLSKDNVTWKATLDTSEYVSDDSELFDDKKIAEAAASVKSVTVTEVTKEEKAHPPAAPFITSTLQQVASSKLKIKPKQTMALAQTLFGAGLITYHRTDSYSLSAEAVEAIRQLAQKCDLPVPNSPRVFKNKKGAQEGHEAIRPSDIDLEQVSIDGKSSGELKELQRLYSLIRDRVIVSQLSDFVEDVTKITYQGCVSGETFTYHSKASQTKLLGWKSLPSASSAKADALVSVPNQDIGDVISEIQGKCETKLTTIPSLYTEASLIKDLERKGIGRPSTYASIMDRIGQHGYVTSVEKQYIDATSKGVILFNLLFNRFSFVKLTYTREMESQIDDIANGKLQYQQMIQSCYSTLLSEMSELSGVERQSARYECEKCHKEMRRISKGKDSFWGCSAFNDGCKNTWRDVKGVPITPEHPEFGKVKSAKKAVKAVKPCSACGDGKMVKRGSSMNSFLGCSNYPKCGNTESISTVRRA